MPMLDANEIVEKNYFERIGILYRRLDLFPGSLQARVINFVSQYGAISDTPIELAGFLERFVCALAPHLKQ